MSSASRRGFTALEMLVVIGIFTLVTGVVMASLPQFREKTLLDLTAQQMATIIRQAQVYGLGTRSAGTGQYPSHGINFDAGNDNKAMILFADANGDGKLTGNCSSGSECVERYVLQGSVQIASVKTCAGGVCTTRNPLHIIFKRPNPEAIFYESVIPPITADYAKICIQSTRDPSSYREIRVSNTGQIYARNNNVICP